MTFGLTIIISIAAGAFGAVFVEAALTDLATFFQNRRKKILQNRK